MNIVSAGRKKATKVSWAFSYRFILVVAPIKSLLMLFSLLFKFVLWGEGEGYAIRSKYVKWATHKKRQTTHFVSNGCLGHCSALLWIERIRSSFCFTNRLVFKQVFFCVSSKWNNFEKGIPKKVKCRTMVCQMSHVSSERLNWRERADFLVSFWCFVFVFVLFKWKPE